MQSKQFRKFILVSALGLLVTGALVFYINRLSADPDLEIIFFDVGQGDSIFINTPSDQQILIDGGPDTRVVSKVGEQLSFFDHHLDLVVLTHAHADHIIGLVEILKRYDVDYVMYNDMDLNLDYYLEWEQVISDQGIKVLEPVDFQEMIFGEVKFDIIYPFYKLEGDIDDLNNTSIVMRMRYHDFSALLTGDATAEVEEKILQRDLDVSSDILKVGHHGSKYSSSANFLEAVDPTWAIIQCGQDNKFGHPHEITLRKLHGQGVEILRNDELGDFEFIYDNGELIIK